MKKLLLSFAFLIVFIAPSLSFGQFALYSWTDTTSVTTSQKIVTASIVYQHLIVYADTVDVMLKWNTAKTYILLKQGTFWSFGPSDKVSTLYLKTVAGTGLVYTAGLKTQSQPSVGF